MELWHLLTPIAVGVSCMIAIAVFAPRMGCKGCRNPPLMRRAGIKRGNDNAKGYLSHFKCDVCGKESYEATFSTGTEPVDAHWASIFMKENGSDGQQ
jgi:transposase-like protein